ncbi:hypothetical protein HYDPIDRAFT_92075, partial [Hydnomerulius pinastri MD-312]
VAAIVFEGLGLILTAARILFRLRIGRFWWEDAWAVITLLCGLLWIISQWIYLYGSTSIIASWITSLAFTCIVTAVRMSILLSITRVVQRTPFLRKVTYACAAFFAACWIILMVEKVWWCASSSKDWQRVVASNSKPFCQIQNMTSVFQFSTDAASVTILVVLPLRMLWKVKLPRRQRRMILSIFATSVVIAIGALFHTLGQVLDNNDVMVAGLHVEIALALIVCNLLVVVTCAYRFLRDNTLGTEDTSEDTSVIDDDFTRPARLPRSTVPNLTTIELPTGQDTSSYRT